MGVHATGLTTTGEFDTTTMERVSEALTEAGLLPCDYFVLVMHHDAGLIIARASNAPMGGDCYALLWELAATDSAPAGLEIPDPIAGGGFVEANAEAQALMRGPITGLRRALIAGGVRPEVKVGMACGAGDVGTFSMGEVGQDAVDWQVSLAGAENTRRLADLLAVGLD